MSDLLAGTTPGPWRVRENARHSHDECDLSICGDIWVLADVNGPPYAHQEANAKLIAAAPTLATENTALRSLCAELVEACASMIRWDDAEKNARPFDEDNGAGFYARMEMCGEAFEKARAAIARSKELLP